MLFATYLINFHLLLCYQLHHCSKLAFYLAKSDAATCVQEPQTPSCSSSAAVDSEHKVMVNKQVDDAKLR